MYRFAIVVVLAFGLAAVGCGSGKSNGSGNINGNWTATLTDSNGTPVFGFGTSLTVNNGGTLSITNFNFTTNSACFVSGDTESGSFALTGDFNGNVSGKFDFTINSGSPAGNVLALSGTVNGGTITGTWTLTGGVGCTGNGAFTMNKS
jgi:hypothetical protein